MNFKQNFPTGVKSVRIERDNGKAILFDPNILEETIIAVMELTGCSIKGVTVKQNPDPRMAAWKNAVASDETQKSFEDYCESLKP